MMQVSSVGSFGVARAHVAVVLSAVAALVGVTGAEAGGHAGFGCPTGFDVGAVTLQEYLNLPRHQAGLQAGAYDEAFLLSAFTDRNGDGLVCAKDVAAQNGGASFWQYVYNIADDNASALQHPG